jgi:Zn finger protein HypA/HybF involved in hydrogenase expression
MLLITDVPTGLIILAVLFVIGSVVYIRMKRKSKEIKCDYCGAIVYVEQMNAENCPECGSRLR